MKAKVSLIKQELDIQVSKQEVTTFLDAITPQSIRDLGGVISDTVKLWRYKNEVRIIESALKYAKAHGIKISPVNLKILAPLLDNASLEEDATMQQKWAAMLTNAATKTAAVEVSFPHILKQLSPVEVQILDWAYGEWLRSPDKYIINARTMYLNFKLSSKTTNDISDSDLITDSLVRLGLWRPRAESIKNESLQSPETMSSHFYHEREAHQINTGALQFALSPRAGFFDFTELGLRFIMACKFSDLSYPKRPSKLTSAACARIITAFHEAPGLAESDRQRYGQGMWPKKFTLIHKDKKSEATFTSIDTYTKDTLSVHFLTKKSQTLKYPLGTIYFIQSDGTDITITLGEDKYCFQA